jgi:hypothetical protein
MEIQKKRKTRMYEPYGYVDENNYQSSEIIKENDLDSFFADVQYKKDDNKIHFSNKDGNEVATIDVNEFVKSDSVIDRTEYSDGILKIYFTNGDVVTIDLSQLLDENEFRDGLIVDNHVIKVLVDGESERWLTVSENGVKVSGIQAEIDRLDGKIDDETTRATSEEERIEGKLDKEIQDRVDDVDAEETRAKNAEQALTTNLNNEVNRAIQREGELNNRLSSLNDELDAEESIRESNDVALGLRITTETNRATSAETALNTKIEQETSRATAKEQALDARIDDIISGSSLEKLDELIEKLGYKDNETLTLTNEHEVAFGEYNVSNTDVEPSGQTIFSIGIGTSAHDKKNALEVRKDGSVYMWIEGDFMNVNKLLGQIAHEVYDNNG